LLLAGLICGLAGSYLPLATAGSFQMEMTAGKGFIALAAVIFGAWNPVYAFGAALVFGFADATQACLHLRRRRPAAGPQQRPLRRHDRRRRGGRGPRPGSRGGRAAVRPGLMTTASTPPATPIPVVLDCDPGHDDALAIALALARPELRVMGITTVAGNARLPETTRNALRVLALLGREDVPVAAGADAPLVRPLEIALAVHGASGLDGADLSEPRAVARPEGALAFLREILEAAPEPVTLIPTGPLTNVARLLAASLAPRIARSA
jgi:hypothetical protein